MNSDFTKIGIKDSKDKGTKQHSGTKGWVHYTYINLNILQKMLRAYILIKSTFHMFEIC